jgi:Bacterial CdiA-CT RNAse A domain
MRHHGYRACPLRMLFVLVLTRRDLHCANGWRGGGGDATCCWLPVDAKARIWASNHFRVHSSLRCNPFPIHAVTASRRPFVRVLLALFTLAVIGCDRPATENPASAITTAKAPVAFQPPHTPDQSPSVHDLSVDESMGGHTLTRHVGKTDAELLDRLRREPQISSASTYVDRATAERVVGATLASAGGRLKAWLGRDGRRPNLALHYSNRGSQPIGRSLSRGHETSTLCDRALVVLRWDERHDRFYVLTSYPEVDR